MMNEWFEWSDCSDMGNGEPVFQFFDCKTKKPLGDFPEGFCFAWIAVNIATGVVECGWHKTDEDAEKGNFSTVEFNLSLTQKSKNMFYTFPQNNSGGCWRGPKFVCIEASSEEEANTIAQNHGVYFDGVKDGKDCSCCGNRWHRVFDYHVFETPQTSWGPLEDEKSYKIVYKDGNIVTKGKL